MISVAQGTFSGERALPSPGERTRKKLLIVLPFVPHPLRGSGGTIRYVPIIEHLSRHYEVDIIVLAKGSCNPGDIEAARARFRNLKTVDCSRYADAGIVTKGAYYLYSKLPWSAPHRYVTYGWRKLVRQIARDHGDRTYDCLVWVGADYAEYMADVQQSIKAARSIIDLIDSPSLFRARECSKTGEGSLSMKYDTWKIRRWEGKLIRQSDATIYISAVDAATVPEELGPLAGRHVIPNGITSQAYSKATRPDIPSPNIGFLGHMGYSPNVDAVRWLYENVFVPARQTHPDLSLVVIGRNPADSVRELGRHPGVTVTGPVDDVWPYINSIDVFVFPLQFGAGMKNKILEAMFARKPVLTTRIGNEGIDGVAGRDLLICETAEEFRRNAMGLLGQPEERRRIGASAHEFVVGNYSWGGILERYDGLIEGEGQAAS